MNPSEITDHIRKYDTDMLWIERDQAERHI